MDSALNLIKSEARNLAEKFTPVLKESKFKETGVITPEEFVLAGDHLVHHYPTWQWAAGEAAKVKPFLPPDKQFLITRNVPCLRRVKDMDYNAQQEKLIEGGDVDGGWVDTHHYSTDQVGPAEQLKDLSLEQQSSNTANVLEDEEDQEAVDLETYTESDVEDDDPNAMTTSPSSGGSAGKDSQSSAAKGSSLNEGGTLAVRTYDLNITYDRYYQTPRMWLMGYDENRVCLSVDKMYEDFSEDHANKTITMDAHPHLPPPPMASIHPCRHAETMKKLMDTLAENGKDLQVHHYLLVFLKFVQAVIPTIEYDFTRNVQL